jgi:hypothetical protein
VPDEWGHDRYGRSECAVTVSRPARLNVGDEVIYPDTGKARLGYDRARILLAAYTGW